MQKDETFKFQALTIAYHHWRMPEVKKEHRDRGIKACQEVVENRLKSRRFESYLLDFWEWRDDRKEEFLDQLEDFDQHTMSLCPKCKKNIKRVEVFYHELDDEEWVEGHVICKNPLCKHIHYKSTFNLML